MSRRPNHYTIMFLPDDNGRSFSLRVNKNIARSLLIFLLLFITCLGLLVFKSGEIAAKLQLLYSLRLENERLTSENQRLRNISARLDHITELASYIEKMANPALKSNLQINSTIPNPHYGMSDLSSIQTDTSTLPQLSTEEFLNSVPNIAPVEGWITRKFNSDSTSIEDHLGVDFAAATSAPIKATAPGIVDNIRNDKYFGQIVTIRHEHGFMTKYGHCSQILVSLRDSVKRGQTIALVGSTGRSTAPHLHYELLKDGKDIDPSNYMLSHQE